MRRSTRHSLPAVDQVGASAGHQAPEAKYEADLSYSPQALLAELVIEAAKTPRGGYSRRMLKRWGMAWPPPHNWPRDLVARWTKEPERELVVGQDAHPSADFHPNALALRVIEMPA